MKSNYLVNLMTARAFIESQNPHKLPINKTFKTYQTYSNEKLGKWESLSL